MQKQSISLSTRSALYYHTKTMPNITLTTPHHNSRMLKTEIHSNVLEKGCYDSNLQKGRNIRSGKFQTDNTAARVVQDIHYDSEEQGIWLLSDNDFIDKKIQKGFWPKKDGVSEHTELLTHLIADGKRNARSLVVSLMDLRNAFGEVQHNLIRAAIKYHHLPEFITDIFNSIYRDSTIYVSVNKGWTSQLKVKRGVLQGDPLYPLLFNLCFNTLMPPLEKSELANLGYIWGPKEAPQSCTWLQFANDAVIIANNLTAAQTLINIFAAWCNWSGMSIRLDKCCTFGMLKKNNGFGQIEPALYLNSEAIPVVAMGDSFTYLGKKFDFELKNKTAKVNIRTKLELLLNITSGLKVKPQTKLKILKQ